MQLGISLHASAGDPGRLLSNGMTQNIKFFYDLLELLGHSPFFLIPSETQGDSIDIAGCNYRCVTFAELEQDQREVPIVFEVGATIFQSQRSLLREHNNSKIVVIKYGNSQIIDLECIVFATRDLGQLNVTSADKVWYSPHFSRSKHYLQSIYDCEAEVCPYLWEPEFVTSGFSNAETEEVPDVFVMEPNLNVVKSAIIPVCIINDLYKEEPDAFGKAMILNALKLQKLPYFLNNIVTNLPALHGSANKVFFAGRASFEDVFARKNILLGHHWANSLNYLYCEAIFKGVPFVHNSEDFKQVGYYYEESNVEQGVLALKRAIDGFHQEQDMQKNHAFLSRYSITNNQVQAGYARLIEDVLK